MIVLLDESGDLGWNFDFPYNRGGSSRYLSLACLFLPKKYQNQPEDIIKSMYKKIGWKKEKKASEATFNQKIKFCNSAIELLTNNKEIKVDVITANKENVQEHIRKDSNKLYNYMASRVIPEYIKSYDEVDFVPDERSVKVRSGNSLADYLQIKLWFECDCKTTLKNKPAVSHLNYNLQFIDWISHCIWINFEYKLDQPFKILSPLVNHHPLFF